MTRNNLHVLRSNVIQDEADAYGIAFHVVGDDAVDVFGIHAAYQDVYTAKRMTRAEARAEWTRLLNMIGLCDDEPAYLRTTIATDAQLIEWARAAL